MFKYLSLMKGKKIQPSAPAPSVIEVSNFYNRWEGADGCIFLPFINDKYLILKFKL